MIFYSLVLSIFFSYCYFFFLCLNSTSELLSIGVFFCSKVYVKINTRIFEGKMQIFLKNKKIFF